MLVNQRPRVVVIFVLSSWLCSVTCEDGMCDFMDATGPVHFVITCAAVVVNIVHKLTKVGSHKRKLASEEDYSHRTGVDFISMYGSIVGFSSTPSISE